VILLSAEIDVAHILAIVLTVISEPTRSPRLKWKHRWFTNFLPWRLRAVDPVQWVGRYTEVYASTHEAEQAESLDARGRALAAARESEGC
jgi:hypothetical protein